MAQEKKNFIILFLFSLAFFFFKSFSTKDLVENLCILKQKWKAGRKGGIAKASLPIRSFKPLTSEDLLFKYTKGLLVKYAGEEYRGTLVCVALRNEESFICRESSPTTQKKNLSIQAADFFWQNCPLLPVLSDLSPFVYATDFVFRARKRRLG